MRSPSSFTERARGISIVLASAFVVIVIQARFSIRPGVHGRRVLLQLLQVCGRHFDL
jgi:hypothetical protein